MKCARCGRNFLRLVTREFYDNRGNYIEARVCKNCAYLIDQHHEARGSYNERGELIPGYHIKRKNRTDLRDDD